MLLSLSLSTLLVFRTTFNQLEFLLWKVSSNKCFASTQQVITPHLCIKRVRYYEKYPQNNKSPICKQLYQDPKTNLTLSNAKPQQDCPQNHAPASPVLVSFEKPVKLMNHVYTSWSHGVSLGTSAIHRATKLNINIKVLQNKRYLRH